MDTVMVTATMATTPNSFSLQRSPDFSLIIGFTMLKF